MYSELFCAKKARVYIRLYKTMTRILIDDIAIKYKYSIMESPMRLYSKMKNNATAHCCLLDMNKTTDINNFTGSSSQFNGGFDGDNVSLEKVKKELVV